jgi:hypothetical protein
MKIARLEAARDGLASVIRTALPEDQAFVLVIFDHWGSATEDIINGADRAEAARHLRHAAAILELRERRGVPRK